MPSGYPGALDTTALFPATIEDDWDAATGVDAGLSSSVGFLAQWMRDVGDAIRKIETELGIAPSGSAADLASRLDNRDLKDSCIAASAGSNVTGTYSNGIAGVGATKTVGGTTFTLDGVSVSNGARVFLKDQTSAFENGIYDVSGVGSAVLLTRSIDADTSSKLSDSMFVSVEQGAVNADSLWELTTNNPVTVGSTGLIYRRVDANNIARSQLGTDAKGWVFLGHAEVTGSAAVRTPDVTWTGSYAQLQIEHYVPGYAGSAVARIVVGTSAGPSETALLMACQMIENVTVNASPAINIPGWPLAVTVSNVPRYGQMWVSNIAAQVKRMTGIGQYGGTAPSAVPTSMVQHGLWNNTTALINSVRMTSFSTISGTGTGANLNVGSYINVWGRNND